MCTDFILPITGQPPTVVSGRTLDLSPNYDTYLVKEPEGLDFSSSAPNDQEGHSWTNQYGFLGFALETKDETHKVRNPTQRVGGPKTYYSDGLNTQGLSVASLWLTYTEYEDIESPDPSKYLLSADMVGYLLGTCATVSEVQASFEALIVWMPKDLQEQGPNHLSIHDAAGNSLVVEFIKGKKIFYDNNDIGVLTNGPQYDWQAINLNYFFNSCTAKDTLTDQFVQMVEQDNGQLKAQAGDPFQFEVLGSGMHGLPGDATSPSRFLRAAKLRHCVPSANNAREGVQYAMQILGRIWVCEEEVLFAYGKENTYDLTLWMTIRDHSNLVVYFATHLNHTLQAVEMKHLDFSKGSGITKTLIALGPWYVDATKRLKA